MRKVYASRVSSGLLLLAITAGPALAGNPQEQQGDGQRPHGPPPQVAIDACAKLSEGAACSFTGRRGEAISGSCRTPPQQSTLACVPAHAPMQQQQQQQQPNDDSGPSRGY
jgi:hypothetical protein